MTTRTILTALAMLLAIALFQCAHAATVGVHLVSYHAPARGQQNTNPGLYVRADDWQAGIYHNSYSETTVYGGRSFELGNGFEVLAGIGWGYQRHSVGGKTYGASPGALAPMVALTYTLPVKILGMQPKVFAIPPTPKNSAVLHLALEF
jgi:hypothetical protein